MEHTVTFPLRLVTFPGYVFFPTGDDSGMQLGLINIKVEIEEYIGSGQAAKLSSTKCHSMPYPEISTAIGFTVQFVASNQKSLEFYWLSIVCNHPINQFLQQQHVIVENQSHKCNLVRVTKPA